MRFRPTPVQQPRIPIWVGGNWGKRGPMRRAARWDGYWPLKWGEEALSTDEWREIMAYVKQHRNSDAPFDWIHAGPTPGNDPAGAADTVRPYAEAGVTWWVEAVDPWRFGWRWEDDLNAEAARLMDERIRQGPPKL
jgi:hypothetical protein